MLMVVFIFYVIGMLDVLLPIVLPIFIGVGAFGFAEWILQTGYVIIDLDGITMLRLWTQKRINYTELSHVRNHLIWKHIALHSLPTRIRVEHQLRGFPTFLEVLRTRYQEAMNKELPGL